MIGGRVFREKAPGGMDRLMADFGLNKEQAAAILGNLGHESAGFTAFSEGGNGPGRGWAQWTDPGRKARFFEYSRQHNLDPKSDEANYGFLKWELEHTHKSALEALKRSGSVGEGVRAFEEKFEGARFKAYGSRDSYALQALRAYEAVKRAALAAPQPSAPTPVLPIFASPQYDLSRAPRLDPSSLVGDTSTDNSRSVVQHIRTDVTVNGGTDPVATAHAIGAHQDKVSSLSMRNAQGALR